MSVIDAVDLATGREIVLMIVTMDTEDLVEGQGHLEGEGTTVHFLSKYFVDLV